MAYTKDTEKIKNDLISQLKECQTEMELLQQDRAKALRYYLAKELEVEPPKGRSRAVVSDVSDVIEWLKPDLMKIFYGGQTVVDVRPQGKEDEVKAVLMAEKINFDFQVALNGFKILLQWFSDALIYKMGVVKYSWQEGFEYSTVTYRNVPQESYLAFLMDENFIIDEEEITKEAVFDNGTQLQPAIYKIIGRKKTRISRPLVENIPPEEFGFLKTMREIDDIYGFVYHKKLVKRCHLKQYGINDNEVDGEIAKFTDPVIIERFKDLGGVTFFRLNESSDYFWVYECCHYDFDDDGTPIPMITTIFGDKVIKSETNKYDRPNYCILSPILISHRLCGRSYVDIVKDIALMRTHLLRAILDNCSYQNNAVKVFNPYRGEYDHLLHGNRPGGTIVTKYDVDPGSVLYQIPPMPLPVQVFNMFESVLPEMRMDATGITKYNQGMDSKTLNKTATGISQIMGASQQRKELLARIFAETGMKDLFTQIARMEIKFLDIDVNIKVNNEWKTINRMDLDGKFDIIIDVGIGTGSKEVAFNQKERMLNIYAMIAKALRGDPRLISLIYDYNNVKNILGEMWKDQGYKNADTKFLANTGGNLSGTMPIISTGGNGRGSTTPAGTPIDTTVFPGYGGAPISPVERLLVR